MKCFIGTSGYSYPHWANGIFYPSQLTPNKWLEYYCQQFNSVELNVTFYRLPKKTVFKNWNDRTQKNFTFVLKGSRFITHVKRLIDTKEPLQVFADRIEPLRHKIACFLWQLPPGFKADPLRLDNFCQMLKKTSPIDKADHVFEFREDSWFVEDVYAILKEYNFCLCFADSPKKIGEEVLTSNFIYLRFHGAASQYASNYSKAQLEKGVKKVKAFREKIETVYAFFNNDAHGFAPKNALSFCQDLKAQGCS